MKKLVLLTAVGGLLVSPALAQTSTAPGPNGPQSPPASAQSQPNGSLSQPGSAQTGGVQTISSQTADEWLASTFKGTNVVGADDQKIGSVSDILFQRDGKVLAYVVSVGGFLGMGAKDVALAPSSFQVQPGQNATDLTLKIAMTKDELKNAAAFAPYKAPAPAPTTGMGLPGNRPTGLPPTRPTGSAQ